MRPSLQALALIIDEDWLASAVELPVSTFTGDTSLLSSALPQAVFIPPFLLSLQPSLTSPCASAHRHIMVMVSSEPFTVVARYVFSGVGGIGLHLPMPNEIAKGSSLAIGKAGL